MQSRAGRTQGLIAAPGYYFILAGGAVLFLGWLLGWTWLAVLGLGAAAFFAYFFRDPERPLPVEAGAIVSPADGKVILLDEVREDKFLQAPAKRVGIFMNVFDVHVNRAPVAGRVAVSHHYPGQFVAAFRPEADRLNERQVTLLEREDGGRVLMLQIAGLLARRIISYVKEEDRLARGERLGLICFGSRVDLYLPPDCEVLVKLGDRLQAGSSIVGRWPEN
ncbi:MAG: phosphatidylserine decarboxylase [Deltaproteobacteria bacterium RBG_13_58_19]|nr:MAG: phosphatidylserine decarboxylase [Deltaproteobacteria bacterium RBG_13_58_19]